MKQIYLSFLLTFICLNLSQSQTYNHVYSKVIGVYQQSSWVSGQEYVIEDFSNFSKCHTNITVGYTFDLETGRNGVIKMYAVNGAVENLVNTVALGSSPVSGSITIPAGLLEIDQFLIKWEIGNTTSSNFIYENFTFTAVSPLASMPSAPIVNNVYYSTAAVAIPLSATGSNLKWYTASTGGMPITIAPTPNTNTPGVTTYWVTQADAGGCESVRQPINVYVGVLATHLNFDGTNDSVSLPVNIGNTLSGGTEVTIEYWFKGTNVQSAVRIQNTSNWIVAGWNLAGNPQFLVSTDGGTNGVVIANSSSIQDNTWHHVACVWKKNEIFATYLDGVLQNSRVAANVNLPIFSGNNGFLGALLGSSEFTNGNLDDVRIWNVARTAAQINGSKNCELQGNESGLLANYKFNQGIAGQDNTTITSLLDATANVYNGTLVNFAKTGTTSNFLSGSPVITGSIVPSIATVSTPVVYGQGATATALTATTGTNGSGLLWYTTATGGTGATTAPTPSTATVGSTSYWVSSTNANGCESARTEIVVNVLTLATHLNFDGVNDYVQVPSGINIANSSFTVEFMAKRTATNVNNYVLKQGNQVNNDLLHIGFRDNNDFTFAFWFNDINIPVSNYVADTNWHHWSCVYNNVNGTRQVYQDGVLVASDSGVSPYTGSGAIQIGSFNGSTYFYNGGIDDVRIWNVARTAEQINGSENCELQGTETGLVAYYNFNQGIDAADNTGITSLIDATTNANNGTLVNFAKTGTTSNFLSGSPVITGSIVPSIATVSTPVVYGQGATATALTATTGTNGIGLVWYTTATGGTGSTTAPTPSTATVGSTSYWVSSTNANGCESARTEIVVKVNALATHLNFDGVNDRVELPNESNFDFTSTFSMEAWIRVTSFTIDWQTVISKGEQGPRIHRFGGSDFIAFGTGPGDDLASTVSVNDGNWHHIAATCNNGFKSLYVDGILQGTQTVGTPLVTNNDNVRIGSQIDSYSPIRAFHGDIDEVRFWNVARTAEQINGSENCELQGTETGLVAYYKFNQGIDASDNSTIISLTDATANANNGTLVNFTKTGAVSNFLVGSPVTTGSIVPSVATVTTPVTYNQGATATALTATTGANGTGLVWYTTATGGTGATTAPTPSTATVGSTSYWVSSTNANGCESARTEIVVNVLTPATHLNFDGVNDYVQIPKTFNSDFTIEFWVKTTSTSSTGPQWYFGKSLVDNEVGGVTSDFGTALVGSKLAFGIGSPDVTIFSTSNINDGNWNHIAVSWKQSSGEMKLYVNGVNESSGTGSTNQRTASNFIKLATNNYLGNYFNGDIDEVRIWNRALPLAEIQNNMNCELPSPSTQNGLLAYYQFNQGIDALDNTSITSLTDTSGNVNNGTLTNFALTGTTSNWLAGSPIVTGTNCAVLSTSNFEIANNIKMYPNPTSNFVTVEVNNLTNAKLQVLDITGKILMDQTLNTNSNNVDVQHLPSGMYFFKVTSNEGTATSKIIKN